MVVFSRVEVEMGRSGFYLGKVFYRLIYSITKTLNQHIPEPCHPRPIDFRMRHTEISDSSVLPKHFSCTPSRVSLYS